MKTTIGSLSATVLLLMLCILFPSCEPTDHNLRVEQMRCQYLTNPLGVDDTQPSFSWIITSDRRGVSQTAYRITVTGPSGEKVWDSDRVSSDQTTGIVYQGDPLESGTQYFWQVTVWDKKGKKANSGKEAWFQTGILKKSDWKATWITTADTDVAAPLFRKPFEVDKKVQHALVFVSSPGICEFYLNGKKVGDHVLDPGRTDFRKRILYVTYDVTDRLVQGMNAMGVMLGNGTYRLQNVDGRYGWRLRTPRLKAPPLLLQLEITYTDGSKKILTTDDSWRSHSSPVTFNHVYGGEDYDARLEIPGWSSPGFDDSEWDRAVIIDDPGVTLTFQGMPPMKVTRTLTPVAVTHPEPGVWLFDMGQNFAGWWRLGVRGKAGVTVRVRGAETLNDSLFPIPLKQGDSLSTKYRYHARVWTDYTLKGTGLEVYEPRFFYTGYRYAEVSTPDPDVLDTLYLEGRVVHTALKETGRFYASDSLLNRIWRAAVWSQKGNLHSVPTDCPHREKGGYNGDGELIAETSMHNFDMAAFYRKWLNDMQDSQFENGRIPNTSPTMIGGYGGGIAWGSAYVLLPWWMYQYYLDKTVLETHYASMKHYLDYLYHLARTDANPGEPFIINAFGGYWDSLGEWCAPGQGDGPNHPVVNTAYYYLDALTLSKIAEMTGRNEDAERYATLADSIKMAFNKKFFHPETNLYGTDTLFQTYQVVALAFDLVPPKQRDQVMQDLVQDILVTHDGHLNTGIVGTKYLWPVLVHHGRSDVAFTVATQTSYPSYGYWINHGATTLWEEWDGSNSHNHQMFGTVSEFFYKYLAGIRSPEDGGTTPGYKHILIKPYMPEGLSQVSASLNTIHGKVSSAWQQTPEEIHLQVVFPANCEATVSIPVKGFSNVTISESGKTVWENGTFSPGCPGITVGRAEEGCIVLECGSGHYDFLLTGK